MQARVTTEFTVVPAPAVRAVPRARAVLTGATVLAVAAGCTVLAAGGGATHDPDLLRLMRFMAAIKGGFALAALAASLWRLARPTGPWRRIAYVAGPPLMIVGACGLWAMRDPGLAALALHGGLIAVLAAALTDPDFVPDRLPRPRRTGNSASGLRRM